MFPKQKNSQVKGLRFLSYHPIIMVQFFSRRSFMKNLFILSLCFLLPIPSLSQEVTTLTQNPFKSREVLDAIRKTDEATARQTGNKCFKEASTTFEGANLTSEFQNCYRTYIHSSFKGLCQEEAEALEIKRNASSEDQVWIDNYLDELRDRKLAQALDIAKTSNDTIGLTLKLFRDKQSDNIINKDFDNDTANALTIHGSLGTHLVNSNINPFNQINIELAKYPDRVCTKYNIDRLRQKYQE